MVEEFSPKHSKIWYNIFFGLILFQIGFFMKTQCPNCKAKFNINEANVGKKAKCSKCAQLFTIAPFVETPVSSEPAVKSPVPPSQTIKDAAPQQQQIKNPEPVETPKVEKTPEPVAAAEPLKSPEQMPQIKGPAPAAPAPLSAKPAPNIGQAAQEEVVSKPSTKPSLSKAVFVYFWTGVRITAGVLASIGLVLILSKHDKSSFTAAFAAADIFIIISLLIEFMLFYKMWAAIKDTQTSISPGKAVGFLFIPVFNIYWALLMITGFVEDYNGFVQRRSIKTQNLPMLLFMIYSFMFILTGLLVTIPMMFAFGLFPYINAAFINYSAAAWALLGIVLAIGTGHFITYLLVALKTCNAVNVLPATR
ncbi:MAG: hypothetical protein EHM20_18110 [Alphaproteobacteria bacterium]|nr:MAG: hypothetical protein EHM20_18110 [Alphaproteobacteria bacterium]